MSLDKKFAVGRFAVMKSCNFDALIGSCREIVKVHPNINSGLLKPTIENGRQHWVNEDCVVAVVDSLVEYERMKSIDDACYEKIKQARLDRAKLFQGV